MSAPHRIDPKPTDGMSYDSNAPLFWDALALGKELTRAFDICHGCRMCFNLCPTFPSLFELVDKHDGDVTKLTAEETDAVTDTCFQCKICYVKCPYTPDDKHAWALDFPKLLMRKKAIDAKRDGVGIREQVLGNPDLVGQVAKVSPALVNWTNNTRFHRVIIEKLAGIHRDKKLPAFHSESFEEWFRNEKHGLGLDGTNGKAALFFTCFVNYNNPGVGKAVVDVLAKNGVNTTCPKQNCCGMPALDGGDVEFAKKQAIQNVEALLPVVRSGRTVLAINPTCSMTLKKEYPTLVGTPEAAEVAAGVMDVNEYLFTLKKAGTFNRDFKSTPGKVAYHVPCHLRAQNVGFRSRDMMKTIGGTDIDVVAECCGHDGTWAMKTEFYELSIKAGKKAFEGIKEAKADVTSTDCPLAAVQLSQHAGVEALHPCEVMSKAYRAPGDGGFATPVPPKEKLP